MKKIAFYTIILILIASLTYFFYENISHKKSSLKSVRVKNIVETHDSTGDFSVEEDEVTLGSAKADDFYIEETVRNFKYFMVKAVNENDFSLIENFLLEKSELYNSQKQLVSSLASKKVKKELIKFYIENIEYQDKDDIKVYVYEQIGIKYPDEERYPVKDYYLVYTLRGNEGLYKIIDIEQWQKDRTNPGDEVFK